MILLVLCTKHPRVARGTMHPSTANETELLDSAGDAAREIRHPESVSRGSRGSLNTDGIILLVCFRLWPGYASAHNNLGTLTIDDQAEYHFLAAINAQPGHVNAHYNLGRLYRSVR